MQAQNIIRTLLFIIFFAVGATALAGAILCDDLIEHYHNKHLLKELQTSIQKLDSLNTDYDVLLTQLEQDPNLIKRIAPATLGTEPNEPNTAYPRATAQKLAAARQALTEDTQQINNQTASPQWLSRCCRPRRRAILLACGACLVLISFIFFGPAKPDDRKKTANHARNSNPKER